MARFVDEFLIYVPDSTTPPVIARDSEDVLAAMEDLGKYARVRRITEGELSRDVTERFTEDEPDEDEDSFYDPSDWLHQQMKEGVR